MKHLAVDLSEFEEIPSIKPDSGTHTVTRGKLPSSEKIWVCKQASNELIARIEVLAQEFHRLMNPEQPETWLARDAERNFYVLSEAVDGKPVPLDKPQRFSRGVYTGLGQILVYSVFLHEVDLNPGNLILKDEQKLIKLDGDWCFVGLTRPELLGEKPARITAEILRALPHVQGYVAYNWLDMRRFGRSYSSSMVDDELRMAPHFQAEINQAILKLLLLPVSYAREFIKCYLTDYQDYFLIEFTERQAELLNSALQLDSFRIYLRSAEADAVMDTHLDALQGFAGTQEGLLLEPDNQVAVLSEFWGLREKLLRAVQVSPNNVWVDHGQRLDTGMSSPLRMFSPTKDVASTGLVRRSSTCSNLLEMG